MDILDKINQHLNDDEVILEGLTDMQKVGTQAAKKHIADVLKTWGFDSRIGVSKMGEVHVEASIKKKVFGRVSFAMDEEGKDLEYVGFALISQSDEGVFDSLGGRQMIKEIAKEMKKIPNVDVQKGI